MPLFRNDNPYRRRNALLPSNSFFASGVIIALAIIIIALRLLVPGFLTSAVAPLWRAGSALSNGVAQATSVFGNATELTRERNVLADENLALNESNRALIAQVADLQNLIGSRTQPEKGILASVLSRPPVAPYDTLIVDAGSKAGVATNALVYGPGGVPLGTVGVVTDTSSRIELFSTGGRVTSGWVGDTRIPITLTGLGGGAFSATLPRDSGVGVNAVVYVPGPGALPIGTVVRVDSSPSSPNDTVHIAPYVNLFSLTWVTIAPHS